MDQSRYLHGMGEQSIQRQQKYPAQGVKVKKSSSFNEQYRRKRSTPKRNTHTVPSDKDENERIEQHRRECLSKAIQWNMVDLIKQSESFQADRTHLRDALTHDELKHLERFAERKRKFRMFLCFLMKKTFVIMQTWLSKCGLDKDVIQKVWEAYGDFSDKVTNKKMKCFSCRLSSGYCVTIVADHLYSALIIDDPLYETIITSDLPVGLQMQLWKAIFRQCDAYTIPIYVVVAFEIALRECLKDEEIDELVKIDIQALLTELDTLKDDPECFLNCYCSKICAKALQPLSCVRTMPISQLYFRKSTPPKSDNTAVKSIVDANTNSDDSSDGGKSLSSSTTCTSDDTGAEGDCDSPKSSSSLSSTEQIVLPKDIDTDATVNRKRFDSKNAETSSYSRYEAATVSSGHEDVHRPIYGSAARNSRSVMPSAVRKMDKIAHTNMISKNIAVGCTYIYMTK